MKTLFSLCSLLIVFANPSGFTQVTINDNNWFFAQEFSKVIALYEAKSFLFNNVLGSTSEVVKFEVIPLAAAASGELTTLIYKCESKQKEGLILGFYGDYWNEAGVIYKGFAFKNLDKDQAINFLDKIQNAIHENSEYLLNDKVNNNIYFKFDDIKVLISAGETGSAYDIRLFWLNFDASWGSIAFDKSKRRFEKRIK